ncbi:hypothetical protein HIM_11075 [Hirsutella minnesotensis 3608]|uniref:Uncharacterized protein n=1 Tax=Hirsutella minnesotensis 3608 TaxID=1043627 RepID=A0A0F7ZRF7_9HYPO|nr:hypothetical protein HIM_11075 [Hirsutella minnesotensis 3608]
MTKTGTSTQRTILREPQDWDKWVKGLKAHTDKTIHKLLFDEDNSPLEPPIRPPYTDFAADANEFAEQTPAQQRAYAAMFSQYESLRKEYLYETKLITAARTVITESISPAKLTSLHEDETLYQWIKKLEDSTAPSRGFMADRIRSQYTAHLRSISKQTVSSWLAKWEEIIEEADQYFLVEALTGQWLRDIALLIRPLSDGTATLFKKASKVLDEDAAAAQHRVYKELRPRSDVSIRRETPHDRNQPQGRWTFQSVARQIRELVEEQRPSQHLRPLKRGGVFQADGTRKKRKTSPSSDEEENEDQDRCPACKRTGHELKDCWLVFEDRRPSYSRKAPKRIADKIKRVIGESPGLQKKIEEIKAGRN